MNGFGCSTIQLQSVLATTSAASSNGVVSPHHPITCTGKLTFEEDGTFSCPHVSVPPMDQRTRDCITHSIVLLILEEAARTL